MVNPSKIVDGGVEFSLRKFNKKRRGIIFLGSWVFQPGIPASEYRPKGAFKTPRF
jgi:hypothetical protein